MSLDEIDPIIDSERTESFVIFQLGAERYAVEVARVREVLDVQAMTKVPGGSNSLRGLFNLRGHVAPVWDLRRLFGLETSKKEPAEGATRKNCVLMVESASSPSARPAGLLVDRVSDVMEFLPEDLQPLPNLGLGAVSPFVQGLFRRNDRFLLVLDLERVFAALGRETEAHGT